jgi:hypothetical protein
MSLSLSMFNKTFFLKKRDIPVVELTHFWIVELTIVEHLTSTRFQANEKCKTYEIFYIQNIIQQNFFFNKFYQVWPQIDFFDFDCRIVDYHPIVQIPENSEKKTWFAFLTFYMTDIFYGSTKRCEHQKCIKFNKIFPL